MQASEKLDRERIGMVLRVIEMPSVVKRVEWSEGVDADGGEIVKVDVILGPCTHLSGRQIEQVIAMQKSIALALQPLLGGRLVYFYEGREVGTKSDGPSAPHPRQGG